MSAQFWQGVMAATGGWLALSLASCAVLAWFVQKSRAHDNGRVAIEPAHRLRSNDPSAQSG